MVCQKSPFFTSSEGYEAPQSPQNRPAEQAHAPSGRGVRGRHPAGVSSLIPIHLFARGAGARRAGSRPARRGLPGLLRLRAPRRGGPARPAGRSGRVPAAGPSGGGGPPGGRALDSGRRRVVRSGAGRPPDPGGPDDGAADRDPSAPARSRGAPAAVRIDPPRQGLSRALTGLEQPHPVAPRALEAARQEPPAPGDREPSGPLGAALGRDPAASGGGLSRRRSGQGRGQGARPGAGAGRRLGAPPGLEAGAAGDRNLPPDVGLRRACGPGGGTGLAAGRLAPTPSAAAPDAGGDPPLSAAGGAAPLARPVRDHGSPRGAGPPGRASAVRRQRSGLGGDPAAARSAGPGPLARLPAHGARHGRPAAARAPSRPALPGALAPGPRRRADRRQRGSPSRDAPLGPPPVPHALAAGALAEPARGALDRPRADRLPPLDCDRLDLPRVCDSPPPDARPPGSPLLLAFEDAAGVLAPRAARPFDRLGLDRRGWSRGSPAPPAPPPHRPLGPCSPCSP